MKTYILLLLIGICLLSSCNVRNHSSNKRYSVYFEELKQALEKKEDYTDAFHAQLNNYKQKSVQANDIEGHYFYNKLIYERYILFNTDSAFSYIDKNMAIAKQFKKSQWIAETMIAKGYAYTASGILGEAKTTFDKASVLPMNKELREEYYVQKIFYLTHLENFLQNKVDEVLLCADSLIRLDPVTSSPYYLWGRFWQNNQGMKTPGLKELIERKLKVMNPEDPFYSRLCYAAGTLFNQSHDTENTIKYFVKMCVIDIRHVSRDLPMLPAVADLASQVGELNYANRFMRATIAIQNDFPDRVRGSYLNKHMINVYNANIQQLEDRESRYRSINSWLIPIAFILLCFLLLVIHSFIKQGKLRRQLASNNEQLDGYTKELLALEKEMIEKNEQLQEQRNQLSEANRYLAEANFLKENYIGSLFTVCSDYINKTEALHKTFNRKLKAKQYEELLKLTESTDSNITKEVHELYQTFDRIFLSIFPDFVDQFNTLLRPEEQIKLSSKKGLTADLRIYALVRLGINSSVKIASILHVSVQTIYNSRMKIRSKATPSDEEFPQRVMCLGGNLQTENSLKTGD